MATQLNLDISQELNITVRKGDSFSFDITVKDSNGDAVDLRAHQFHMDVRDSLLEDRSNVILSTFPSSGMSQVTLVGGADGTIIVSSTRIAMEGVREGSFIYDIQATNPADSSSKTWFYGSFVINADITDYL